MNSSTCEGPCVFPWAIGILIISNVDNMSVKLCCQVLSKGGTGGSIKRKSSKIWQTNEILHLLSRIHSRASESVLKIEGALLRPNGRTLS